MDELSSDSDDLETQEDIYESESESDGGSHQDIHHDQSNDFANEDKNLSDDADALSTEKRLREDLSQVSFEELQTLKSKLGTKKPTEMSSKQKVSKFREIFPHKKRIVRDPRFGNLSGSFNEKAFNKSYKFIGDIKAKEERGQQKIAAQEKSRVNKVEMRLKKERNEAIKQGKKPYFVKKSEKKQLVLAEKYKSLKKAGTLESYLNKRQKKSDKKGRKNMPNRNQRTDVE